MSGAAFALSAKDFVGDAVFAQLEADGRIQLNELRPKDARITLLPKSAFATQITDAWNTSDVAPTLMGENLYMIPRGDLSIDDVSTLMRAVSRMKGMMYSPNRDGKQKVLYEEAYCIAGPDDRTPAPEVTEGSANGVVQYCLLDDDAFGKTNYRASYLQNDNELYARLTNTTPINLGPIPGVKAENMQINLLVTLCDDYAVVYMNVRANLASIAARIALNSFLSRIDAIYNWFLQEIGRAPSVVFAAPAPARSRAPARLTWRAARRGAARAEAK